ncbi:MAG: hypothetical protein QM296_07935 [Bacillota bacterium]|nr:hypothetical protein [Bacillota bacterium]
MAIEFAITRRFDQNRGFCGQDRLKWQLDLPLHAVLTTSNPQAALLTMPAVLLACSSASRHL